MHGPAALMALVEITEVGPVSPWASGMPYLKSASITPQDIDDPEVTLPQTWFVCVVAGRSGAQPPQWPGGTGVLVNDGTVVWMSYGLYPN